jgi:hypothetical protein
MAINSSTELDVVNACIARETRSLSHSHQPTPAIDPESPGEGANEFSLPPIDGGKDAWLFLAACFTLEGTVWGFPSVFGVFQDYYSVHAPFTGSPSIPVVGTCAMGLMYLGLPVAYGTLNAFPRARRSSSIIGLAVMCLSLSMASFATNVSQLIATQGVLFAIGGVFAWTPCLFYISEWFVHKLSFAFGVTFVSFHLVFPNCGNHTHLFSGWTWFSRNSVPTDLARTSLPIWTQDYFARICNWYLHADSSIFGVLQAKSATGAGDVLTSHRPIIWEI